MASRAWRPLAWHTHFAISFAIRLGDWPLTVGFSVWCFEVMVLRCLADIVLAGRR